MRKPKFKPEITRVKLNPEQAVLQCTCFDTGSCVSGSTRGTLSGCESGSYKLGLIKKCYVEDNCNVGGS